MHRFRTPAAFTLAAFALVGAAGNAATASAIAAAQRDVPANLEPPPGHVLLFELAASGDQIYACQDEETPGTWAWTFQAPEAVLLNANGEPVGFHGAGPFWAGTDGSRVVGAVLERADAPESGDIPWLLLEAEEQDGSGVFSTVTHVQRLDTVGGAAPAEGCDADAADEELRVPYTATYAFFYPAATDASATPSA